MQNAVLENKFNEEVLESIERIKKEVYVPTRFIRMLHQHNDNAVEAVQKLVTKRATYGIEMLWRQGKLNLSVEAIVAKPEYKDLFSEEIVDTCKRKLRLLGYNK